MDEIKKEGTDNTTKEVVKRGDFVEIKYTGSANGDVFDSNIEEDLKKANSDVKVNKAIVVVGEKMVVNGLDKSFENREIGKDYEIDVPFKDGFGERKRELVKTIPLHVFSEHKVQPRPGMMLTLDNALVKIIAVSGARVITDFNNPLSGKDLHYKVKIVRKVSDEKEKAEALFEVMFKFVPEFEIKDEVVVKGVKFVEVYVKAFNDKFKELLGKGLKFELKEPKKKEKPEEKKEEIVNG